MARQETKATSVMWLLQVSAQVISTSSDALHPTSSVRPSWDLACLENHERMQHAACDACSCYKLDAIQDVKTRPSHGGFTGGDSAHRRDRGQNHPCRSGQSILNRLLHLFDHMLNVSTRSRLCHSPQAACIVSQSHYTAAGGSTHASRRAPSDN